MCHLLGYRGHRRPDRRRRAHGPGRRCETLLASRRSRHGRGDHRHHRPGRGRPRAPDRAAVRRGHGVRVHVDAAYGGFFRCIADDTAERCGRRTRSTRSPTATRSSSTRTSTACSPTAAARCCSAIRRSAATTCTTRRTPTSPPTTCTWARSRLECSRAGAAAAALWLTLQLLPLTPDGLGAVLRPGRRAALDWAERIEASHELTLFQPPTGHPHLLSQPAQAVRDRCRQRPCPYGRNETFPR